MIYISPSMALPDRKAKLLPSGDHDGKESHKYLLLVILVKLVPSEFMLYKFTLKFSYRSKTNLVPSGDHEGLLSLLVLFVRRVWLVPSVFII